MSCTSGGMAVLNLSVKRNGVLRRTFTFTDSNGAALNLTSWTKKMQVRPTLGASTSVFTLTGTANGNGSKLTTTDAANGQIEAYISNADIILVPEATDPADAVSYVYDIVLTDTAGDFLPFVGGSFTVLAGVTE